MYLQHKWACFYTYLQNTYMDIDIAIFHQILYRYPKSDIEVSLVVIAALPCSCMQCNAPYSHEKAFCPSVCPSNAWIVTNERKSYHICILDEKSFTVIFWQKEWFMGAAPSIWNYASNWPLWSENADFQSIFTVQISRVGAKIKAGSRDLGF